MIVTKVTTTNVKCISLPSISHPLTRALAQTSTHTPNNTTPALSTHVHHIPRARSVPNFASNVLSHTKQITMPSILSKPAPSALPPKPPVLSVTPPSKVPTGGLRYTEPPQSHAAPPSAIQTSMSDATTPDPCVPFSAALTGPRGLRYTEPPPSPVWSSLDNAEQHFSRIDPSCSECPSSDTIGTQ